MFTPLYGDLTCPIDGYENYTLRLRLNPPAAIKEDWLFGSLGDPDCADCAGSSAKCVACSAKRDRLGRAAVALFGESRVSGLDFSTPASAIDSLEQSDIPDEFLFWLFVAPGQVWAERYEALKKKLQLFSTNPI